METTILGHFNAVTMMLGVNDQTLCTGARFRSRNQIIMVGFSLFVAIWC
jgi:hypothetical protein